MFSTNYYISPPWNILEIGTRLTLPYFFSISLMSIYFGFPCITMITGAFFIFSS